MKTIRMMKEKIPVIGISTEIDIPGRISIKRKYVDAVLQAGGIPFLVPFTNDIQTLQAVISLVDGLLLTGGGDLLPSMYGEVALPECGSCCQERDSYDEAILRLAFERQIPVLGICRGMQLINVCFGGTLYQDLPTQCASEICHKSQDVSKVSQHNIQCSKDGKLYVITGKERLIVSSIHHQAVKRIADGFKATAFSDDGIIEAIESISDRFIWGVQFHPELQAVEGDEDMQRIFTYIVDQAKKS